MKSKTDFASVAEYIAAQPEAVQGVLERVRSIIRTAVPHAEELISSFFAGWKHHYSLYPANDRVQAYFRDELTPYKISKGTIRFPLSEPVPAKLIERIAKFRAKEVARRENAVTIEDASEKSTRSARRKRDSVIS